MNDQPLQCNHNPLPPPPPSSPPHPPPAVPLPIRTPPIPTLLSQSQEDTPQSQTSPLPPKPNDAKIPLRPAKIRKISTNSTPEDTKSTIAKTLVPARLIPCVLARPLSAEGEVDAALRHLRASDPSLAPIIDAHDAPTWQSLHPPFHSLARSILYQQLAFKAASSIYSRFLSLCGDAGVVPDVVLGLSQQQLRQIGVSERKASYLYDLAHKYRSGILSDSSIVAMDDKSLFTMLTMVKGIGAWSVHMFMIFSLHRPDVLPVGDLGVRKGVQILYGLETLPKPSQMEKLCERWRPYRSIGAWYMWRLVEAKGTPTMASVAGIGTQVVGSPSLPQLMPPPPQQQQPEQQRQTRVQHHLYQQTQVIQSIQGFPNTG